MFYNFWRHYHPSDRPYRFHYLPASVLHLRLMPILPADDNQPINRAVIRHADVSQAKSPVRRRYAIARLANMALIASCYLSCRQHICREMRHAKREIFNSIFAYLPR